MDIKEILSAGYAAVIAEFRGMSPRVIQVMDKASGQRVERHLMELSFECGNNGAVNAAQITLWDITAPEKYQNDFTKTIPKGTMCLLAVVSMQTKDGIIKLSGPRDTECIFKLDGPDLKLVGVS